MTSVYKLSKILNKINFIQTRTFLIKKESKIVSSQLKIDKYRKINFNQTKLFDQVRTFSNKESDLIINPSKNSINIFKQFYYLLKEPMFKADKKFQEKFTKYVEDVYPHLNGHEKNFIDNFSHMLESAYDWEPKLYIRDGSHLLKKYIMKCSLIWTSPIILPYIQYKNLTFHGHHHPTFFFWYMDSPYPIIMTLMAVWGSFFMHEYKEVLLNHYSLIKYKVDSNTSKISWFGEIVKKYEETFIISKFTYFKRIVKKYEKQVKFDGNLD